MKIHQLKNSLVLLELKSNLSERDYRVLSCYVYCALRVRYECKHGKDVNPFETFKILFNKWFKINTTRVFTARSIKRN